MSNELPEDDFDAQFAAAAAAAEVNESPPAPPPAAETPAPPPAPPAAETQAPPPAPPAAEIPASPPAPPASSPPAAGAPPLAPATVPPPPASSPPAAGAPPLAPATVPPPPATPAAAMVPVTPPPPTPPAPVRAEPPAETRAEKEAREAREAARAPYQPTQEEEAALARFKADMPGEYAAMMARIKSVEHDVNAKVYSASEGVLQQLQEVRAAQEALLRKEHLDSLHRAHPDYDEVIAKVPEWIKTQPRIRRMAAQFAYEQGTAEDVIELVNEYKAAMVPKGPVVVVPVAPTPPTDAADLAPVTSRRTAPVPRGTPDPDDFEGAFNEAAAAL